MDTSIFEGLRTVANLMAVSACTAPKAGGVDWTRSYITTIEEKNEISKMMQNIGKTKGKAISKIDKSRGEAIRMDWMSDAKSVEAASLLFLIGIQGRKAVGINCGGCGFSSCVEMLRHPTLSIDEVDFPGPFCMFRIMDLSTAAGSAIKTAMDNNVDNRMMQKIGVAVLKMGLLKPCNIILGIPLSAAGKNIFFDRPDKLEAWKIFVSKTD
ncbi:MAG TPA: DUF2148 domain-containing protein [Thermodesulfobacteriota bacterium]|nr:DUF2148 domain-containing protein [Thermodesulfobacteriota bacterium]